MTANELLDRRETLFCTLEWVWFLAVFVWIFIYMSQHYILIVVNWIKKHAVSVGLPFWKAHGAAGRPSLLILFAVSLSGGLTPGADAGAEAGDPAAPAGQHTGGIREQLAGRERQGHRLTGSPVQTGLKYEGKGPWLQSCALYTCSSLTNHFSLGVSGYRGMNLFSLPLCAPSQCTSKETVIPVILQSVFSPIHIVLYVGMHICIH